MKVLFEYLQQTINTRVPEIKTVRMWNNQLRHANEPDGRKEKAFRYPACFIEFIIEEVHNMPLGITDYLLNIRFRFAVEGYKYTRLDTFGFLDGFLAKMHGLAPTTASGLTFTTLQLATPEFDEDFDSVEAPYLDFQTRYRHIPAYDRGSDILHGPITPDATGDVVTIDEL